MNLINFLIGSNILIVGTILICWLFGALRDMCETAVGEVIVTILLTNALLLWIVGFLYTANKYLPLH